MSVPEALVLARDRGLDLVEVAPNEAPPVCRILDYGRLRYLYSKKEREAKKSQKNTALREVRFRPKIGRHDFSSKVRKVRDLLGGGSKVKVAVVFRGREVTHPELGVRLLKRVADEVQDGSRLEKPPGMEGRSISIVLVPSNKKTEKKVAVENAQTEGTKAEQKVAVENAQTEDKKAEKKVAVENAQTEDKKAEKKVAVGTSQTEDKKAEKKVAVGTSQTEDKKAEKKVAVGTSQTEDKKADKKRR